MNVAERVELRRDDATDHDYFITRYWVVTDGGRVRNRLRTHIRVNSHRRQSHAAVEVWNDGEWRRIVHVPGETLQTASISHIIWKRRREDEKEMLVDALAHDTDLMLAEAMFSIGA